MIRDCAKWNSMVFLSMSQLVYFAWYRSDRLPSGELAWMKADSDSTAPERDSSPWFRAVLALFVAGLVVALYLLGLSMVHHRFVQGGRIDRYGHIER